MWLAVRPQKFVSFERNRDFDTWFRLLFGSGFLRPQHLPHASKIHNSAIACSERHDIFDGTANFHVPCRHEQHSTRTDVPGGPDLGYLFRAGTDNFQR